MIVPGGSGREDVVRTTSGASADGWSERLWSRSYELPPRSRRLVLAVASPVGTLLLAGALTAAVLRWTTPSGNWTHVIGPLIGSLLGAAVARSELTRRLGGHEQRRRYEQALRTGRLPEHAHPGDWARQLAAERHVRRRGLVFGPALLAAGALFVLVLLSLGGWSGAVGLVILAVLAVLALAVGLGARRELRRIDRLAAQLPGSADRTPAG